MTCGLPAGSSYPRSPVAKSFMIRSLKHAESDRIWLSGEASMAGWENKGGLWVLSSGLGLQPSIVGVHTWCNMHKNLRCPGFGTLSLASVKNLRRRDARLIELALDRAWTRASWSMCRKRGSTSSIWLNWDWDGLKELSTKMIQWFSCVD